MIAQLPRAPRWRSTTVQRRHTVESYVQAVRGLESRSESAREQGQIELLGVFVPATRGRRLLERQEKHSRASEGAMCQCGLRELWLVH